MGKEQQELVDEAYKFFKNSFPIKKSNPPKDYINEDGQLLTQEEFINNIKTNPELSEKWGLKIEERELNLDERAKLHPNPENFYDIHGTFSISDSIEDSNFPDKDWLHEQFDNSGIPTKLITTTYNNEKIENYE